MRKRGAIGWLVILMAITCQAQELTYDQMKDSLEAATNELRKRPDSNDLRLKKASWNMLLEQWNYAKEEYDNVLKMEPDNLAALYFRAYSYQMLGQYKFARQDYEHILKIVPRHFEAQLGLALLNQKDFRPTEAMNGLNLLVEQYPDSALAYAARGGLEMERGMLDQAEYDYAKAVSLDKGNAGYKLNHFDVLVRLGRKQEARRELDDAVATGIPKAALADYYQMCKE